MSLGCLRGAFGSLGCLGILLAVFGDPLDILEMRGVPRRGPCGRLEVPWTDFGVPLTLPLGSLRAPSVHKSAPRILESDFAAHFGSFWEPPGHDFAFINTSLKAFRTNLFRRTSYTYASRLPKSRKRRFREGQKWVWYGKYAVQLDVTNPSPKLALVDVGRIFKSFWASFP